VNDVLNKFFIYKDGVYTQSSDLVKNIIDNNTVYYNISQYNERNIIQSQVIVSVCKKFTGDDNVCLLSLTYFKEFTVSQTEMLKYKFAELL
jgi:hypothetical protein